MATLADKLRSEIYQQSLTCTKSFLARKEYVIKQIRSGKREVFFYLAECYDKQKEPSREELDKLGVPKGWRLQTTKAIESRGIYYRNGKHYITAALYEDKRVCPEILDSAEYCVEDEKGFWQIDCVYNREELLDVGAYFETEGFRVTINLCSDHFARYPYKQNFFNICALIISL